MKKNVWTISILAGIAIASSGLTCITIKDNVGMSNVLAEKTNILKNKSNEIARLEKTVEKNEKKLSAEQLVIDKQNKKLKKQESKIKKLNSEIKAKNEALRAKKEKEKKKDFKKVEKGRGGASIGQFEMTSYIAMCSEGCTGVTATGIDVRASVTYQGHRIIATDTSIIPLWSIVRIKRGSESFTAISLDTGGAIKGRIVDFLVSSEGEARKNGRQSVSIEIIRKGK